MLGGAGSCHYCVHPPPPINNTLLKNLKWNVIETFIGLHESKAEI